MEVLISELVTCDPRIQGGIPCFKETRIPIFMALEHLADSGSVQETLAFLQDSHDLVELTEAHIQAAIRVASQAAKGYWSLWRGILASPTN